MPFKETDITRFPGGVGQINFLAVGAAAGDVTVAGIMPGDNLLFVQVVTSGNATNGAPTPVASVTDLTSEFSVKAANTLNNTGGTSTANKLIMVTVARTRA
jgi:hypothetical protein